MNLVWQWPQIIIIITYILNLLIGAAMDGKPKTGTHKFGVSFCAVLISILVLYFGGFFTEARP